MYNKKNKNSSILHPIFNKNKVITGYVIDSNSMHFKCHDFDIIKISILNNNDIYQLSKGEITKTATLNYKTLKPEKGGICCTAIFGPIEDYKCSCGRYVGISYNGLRCERCNVIIGSKKLRKLNSAHIELNTYILHPWFYFYICLVLQITKKTLTNILDFEEFIFTKNSGDKKFEKYTVVTSNDYYEELATYTELMAGGEAVLCILEDYNYQEEYDILKAQIEHKKLNEVSEKDLQRFKILELIVTGKLNLTNLLMTVLPVIPADIRPILYLEGGGIASADSNEPYRKLITRTERLKSLLKMEAHEIIINNEKYMIKKAVSEIIGPNTVEKNKSIAKMIQGKDGKFRQHLVGKRCNYSFRGVISVGPLLKIHQCCIPLTIARELYKAYVYSMMLRNRIANSVTEAKRIFEEKPEISNPMVIKVSKDFPIILNRAPALHRPSVQAFEVEIHKDDAIKLSPLSCKGFNADFDGDTTAGQHPCTIESKNECYNLVMSTNSLFAPTNGKFLIAPSKDIVIGLYYMTMLDEVVEIYVDTIYSLAELNCMIIYKRIHTHSRIKFVIRDKYGTQIFITSYARLEIWSELCKYVEDIKLDFTIFNREYDTAVIDEIMWYIFNNFGKEILLHILNFMTERGFYYFTKSGITYASSDILVVPDQKEREQTILNKIKENNNYYNQGLITSEELSTKTISLWSHYIEEIADEIINVMKNSLENSRDRNNIKGNNIYLMYISGSSGSKSQIQQTCGLRGLMATTTGEVMQTPIRSSLRKGLNAIEFFISTHGERKGLSDTALKTAKSGYFERKLFDVAQSVYITILDCKTDKYFFIDLRYDSRKFEINYEYVMISKICAEDINDQEGNIIVKKNEIINENIYKQIISKKIKSVKLRSVLFCDEEKGVCAYCYGLSLTTYKIVDIGEPVGILAAQSIGEPGTQLTMRTTHTGGIATAEAQELIITVKEFGYLDYTELIYAVNSNKEKIVYKKSKILVRDIDNKEILEEIDISEGSFLFKENNEEVFPGDIISNKMKNTKAIISHMNGKVKFNNIIKEVTYNLIVDKDTGISRRKIIKRLKTTNEYLQPSITIYNDNNEQQNYTLETDTFIVVNENQSVKKGDTIAKSFSSETKVKDITGGLTKVINIFDVKKSLNKSILATHNGYISIKENKKTSSSSKTSVNKKNKNVLIVDKDNNRLAKFIIPQNKYIMVHDGQEIKIGETILEGNLNLQDLLDTMGYTYTIKSIIGQVLQTYEEQGIHINSKHLEIIIKKMTEYSVVTEKGSSDKFIGTYLKTREAYEMKQKLPSDDKFNYKQLIIGITKVALRGPFIAAASFQNTISVLAKAAIYQETDYMEGVKENLIFGRLIPVGTGFVHNKITE